MTLRDALPFLAFERYVMCPPSIPRPSLFMTSPLWEPRYRVVKRRTPKSIRHKRHAKVTAWRRK